MASKSTPPRKGDGGIALSGVEGGAPVVPNPNLAMSLTSSTASRWSEEERKHAHAHNRMRSTQHWDKVEELQGQVTDFEDKLKRAGEYGQQLVDRNEYLESRLRLLNAELHALKEDATASSEDTELLYARNGELSHRLQQLEQENLQLSQALAAGRGVGGTGEGSASGDNDTHAQALSSLRAEVVRLSEECGGLRDQLLEKTLEAQAHARQHNTAHAARSLSPPNGPTVCSVRREHASTSTSDEDIRNSITIKLVDGGVCGVQEAASLLHSQSQSLHSLKASNAALTAQLHTLQTQHKHQSQQPHQQQQQQGPLPNANGNGNGVGGPQGQWVLASELEAAQTHAHNAQLKAQECEVRVRRLEVQCSELKQRLEDRDADYIHTPSHATPAPSPSSSSSRLLCGCCASFDSFVRVLMGGGRSSSASSQRPITIGVRRGFQQARGDSMMMEHEVTSDTTALR